ncbi:glycosyltransferase [Psychroserpens sp.]|uniref:glycosyltransferase n=1 Tax=Psychroserpens sp. TaxID=2020870 RepID=UPI002AA62699|nr:glycosyltransferase [Psychroserpens sp.]
MKDKILIIGFVWPEPKSSAAGSRMMQLISFFKSRHYEVTFVSSSTLSKNAIDLAKLGIHTASIQLNSSTFDTFIKELQPDLVLFDRFMTEEQYGWRVSEHCPNAIKILDTEDLHFLRRARQKASKSRENGYSLDLFNDTAKREIASIYRCDLSLIISEFEMQLLTETFHLVQNLLCYLPFLVDDLSTSDIEKHQPFENRQHFMTIGNFLHEPNYDALMYLKKTLWEPIKKALPHAELHNYGAYASEKVSQLHNEREGFYIKGFTEDVNSVMQTSKVLLAPLRFGAGLKGKLFDAMRNGLPFVSSSIGAEGIFDTSQTGCICDDSQAFIDRAIKLYLDQSVWASQQVMGYEVLASKFSKLEFEHVFEERLSVLKANYLSGRQQNFIGQLLQFHNLQSTKYMSKWIELKNRKS